MRQKLNKSKRARKHCPCEKFSCIRVTTSSKNN